MPLRQLIPYVDGLPHILASRAFREAEAIAVGTATMKKSDRASTTDRWKRDLRRRAPRSKRLRSPEALAAAARASGIGFVRVGPPSDTTSPKRGRRLSSTP